jgi:hypothetical protein
MNIRVYYDGHEIKSNAPNGCIVEEIEPLTLHTDKTEEEIITESLEHPISSPSLDKFLSKFERQKNWPYHRQWYPPSAL